jgi:hypothetical protein
MKNRSLGIIMDALWMKDKRIRTKVGYPLDIKIGLMNYSLMDIQERYNTLLFITSH